MPWIKNDIVINFHLPKMILEIFSELEEMERANDVIGYAIRSEELSIMCKNGYTNGAITKQQWDMIERKYCEYD